jgi:hypothetical protein
MPRPDDSEFYRYAAKSEEPASYAQEQPPKESLAEIMNRLRGPDASVMPSKNMLLRRRIEKNFALKEPGSQQSIGAGFNALVDMVAPSMYRRPLDADELW